MQDPIKQSEGFALGKFCAVLLHPRPVLSHISVFADVTMGLYLSYLTKLGFAGWVHWSRYLSCLLFPYDFFTLVFRFGFLDKTSQAAVSAFLHEGDCCVVKGMGQTA